MPSAAPGKKPNLRRTPADRRRLIKRLEALLEKQVDQLEAGTMEQPPDKEVALLSTLARTLEKLMELDAKQQVKRNKPANANAEMDRLRKKLAERMTALGWDEQM